VLVYLVGNDQQVVLEDDLLDRLEFLAREHLPRGVHRRVQQEDTGRLGGLAERIDVEFEAVRDVDGDGFGAREPGCGM